MTLGNIPFHYCNGFSFPKFNATFPGEVSITLMLIYSKNLPKSKLLCVVVFVVVVVVESVLLITTAGTLNPAVPKTA